MKSRELKEKKTTFSLLINKGVVWPHSASAAISTALPLLMLACQLKDSGDGKKNVTEPIVNTAAGINKLAEAYPEGLAISVFPQASTQTALALLQGDQEALDAYALAADTTDDVNKTIAEKKADEKKVLEGKGTDCVAPILKSPPKDPRESESCYEFDHDLVRTTLSGTDPSGQSITKTYGTTDGLNASGETCLTAFARERAEQVSDQLERAKGMIQTMMCQAKKSDPNVKLPEIGETLDLKAAMSAGLGNKAKNITAARITRLADQEERSVYETEVVLSEPQGSRTIRTRISKEPADDSLEIQDYDGVMWSIWARDNDARKLDQALSITFRRVTADSKSRLQAEVKFARVARELIPNAFGADGVLDFNVGTDASGEYLVSGTKVEPNRAVSGSIYLAFDQDAIKGDGSLTYFVNPGGNYKEAARGMNFVSTQAEDGTVTGCGTTGAAVLNVATAPDPLSIRRAIKEGLLASLVPGGFYHPFINTLTQDATVSGPTTESDGSVSYTKTRNGDINETRKWLVPTDSGTTGTQFVTQQFGGIITKQCFKKAADATRYTIDATKTSAKAGYELVLTTDTGKIIPPPALGKIKPPPKLQ